MDDKNIKGSTNPYVQAIKPDKSKTEAENAVFNIASPEDSAKKAEVGKNKSAAPKAENTEKVFSFKAAKPAKAVPVKPEKAKKAEKKSPVKTEKPGKEAASKAEKPQKEAPVKAEKPEKEVPAKPNKEKSAPVKNAEPAKAEKTAPVKTVKEKTASEAKTEEAAEKPKKKFGAFKKGLLIYSGVLVLAAVIALIVLYSFLNAYEHSRPLNCINDYLSEMESGELSENLLAAFSGIDENIQSREESEAYIRQILPEVKPGKSSKLSTAENPAYILTYDKKPLGTVYLKAMEKQPFGFTFWELDHDEYDLEPFTNSHSLVLPSDYKLVVNGQTLGAEYIKNNSIEYKSLAGFYDYYDDLPHMVKYESGKYLGPESFSILDASGKEVSPEALSETDFLSNSTEDEIAEVKTFTDDFVSRYVAYAANLNGSWFYNYMHAKYLTVPGSLLESRLAQAMGSFGYSTIYSCDILSNDINFCYKHGDRYIVDISYVTETVARGGPVQQTNNIRLSVVPGENEFLAEIMLNY